MILDNRYTTRLPLTVNSDQVTCRAHKLETCTTCDLDFSSLNQLSKNLKAINGRIPASNAANPNLSTQINRLKDEGNKNFHAQNYAEAIRLYSLAVDMAFQRPVWESYIVAKEEISLCLCNRAAAYIANGAWVDAYVDTVAVVKIRREWSKGHFRMGKALVGLKRYDEAIDAFNLGLELEPQSEEIRTALKDTETLISQLQKD
ncbi:6907_t:CDS:2 [Ambispora leptoticha]|uniref:6907_t:CDS:1 n=1 Tax=Ambispora leptoticha TaxID=144679 RepID=A0A9N9D5E2_9GLOM|nr:6907_t:CDS:2 [Ambispora leptoticha]